MLTRAFKKSKYFHVWTSEDRQVLKQRGTKTTIEVKQYESYGYKNNCVGKTTVKLYVQNNMVQKQQHIQNYNQRFLFL